MPRPFAATLIAACLFAAPLSAQPKKWALLVGVNNYEGTGLGSLNHTVRDMESLREVLINQGFTVKILRNQDATRVKIEATLKELNERRHAGDLALVALSGHGVQTSSGQGEEDAFFCPFGCDKSNIDSLLSLTTLVKGLGAKGTNLVLVDACRDDPRKGFKGVQGNKVNELPADTAVLFSCSSGQQSFETNAMSKDPSQGHGVFFYHVLEGLKGAAKNAKGEVTWSLLVDYVIDTVDVKAKEWFSDRAKQTARDRGIEIAALKFQTPHQVTNLNSRAVLATFAAEPKSAPMAESNVKERTPVKEIEKPKPNEEPAKGAIKVPGPAIVNGPQGGETKLIYLNSFGSAKQDENNYSLDFGTRVKVIAQKDNRYQIEWSHGAETRTGWVDKTLLRPADAD